MHIVVDRVGLCRDNLLPNAPPIHPVAVEQIVKAFRFFFAACAYSAQCTTAVIWADRIDFGQCSQSEIRFGHPEA